VQALFNTTPHSLKISRVCFGGHVMKQKIPFPKRLGRAFWILKPFMKWNFSFAKGLCILVFKMSHILFFPLIPFGHNMRKEGKKKKDLLPYGALCWVMPEG
jgi:hypothetical protein